MVSSMQQLIAIRAFEPDDLPAVGAMFDRVSHETIYRRFFSGGVAGPRSELRYLAEVDGHDRLALIAVCLLYTSPSPRDLSTSRMPSSA